MSPSSEALAGPILWFANRGTGMVLLVLYTLVVVLGLGSAAGSGPGRLVPRFVAQGLHRTLALLASLLLLAHVVTAVADDYVDIRWFDAVLPVGGLYRPVFLGLGALSLDLLVAVGLTSALRGRLSDRVWRRVHLAAYPSWAAAVVHTLGIGTDLTTSWGRWTVAACVCAVSVAAIVRTVGRLAPARP